MTEQTEKNIVFRNDINGLRAWAVISVVLYHFRIPGFDGGFVGVDVFFVISGFLMTGIIVKGLEQQRFGLIQFYVRRATRIFPALIFLCACLLLGGWFFTTALDFRTLATHAISALTFVSNFKFWDEAGYFDSASNEKWLLHTWSLSVEWQFYLILPIVIAVIWKVRPDRQALKWVLIPITIASFIASAYLTHKSTAASFFLLHTRAWEMLAGGLVYLLPFHLSSNKSISHLLEKTGLALIIGSVFLLKPSYSWPGWLALLPVIGSVLVLVASRTSSNWTGNRACQWIGDRSYSIYLWHWPIWVGLTFVEWQSDPVWVGIGLFLSLAAGAASYRWVEQPGKRLLSSTRDPVASSALAAGLLVALAPAILVRTFNGFDQRLPNQIEAAAKEETNMNPRRKECHPAEGGTSPSCIWGNPNGPRVVVVGDSHASALVSGISAALPNHAIVQWSYSGCSFVPGLKFTAQELARSGPQYKCEEFVSWADAQLRNLPSSIPVIIINRYAAQAMGPNEAENPPPAPGIFFTKQHSSFGPALIDEFSQNITRTACEAAKNRKTFVMRPIPEMGIHIPKVLARRMAFGLNDDISIPFSAYMIRNDWVWKAQDEAAISCGVEILDPTKSLCRDGICFGSQALRPLYSDDDHLSESGNKRFSHIYEEIDFRR